MLKKIIRRMLCMQPAAWYIFRGGLQLCAVLLLLCFVSLLKWGGDMYNAAYYYKLAVSFNETAQAVLLIAVLFSVIAEDIVS
ncbi:MAG: hypothetical protein Q4E35_09300 [Eubacteriales bacterium]|nr:hypothetical protein [Eubacteriales bacterium]